jgi:tetratricopeptide (TPR) repeat protein
MIAAPDLDSRPMLTTDGDIAVINLESARRRSWSRFFEDPLRDGTAESVVGHEQLVCQFVGDLSALARLEFIATELVQAAPVSARTALIQAQVASTAHRFADARHYLAQAANGGAASDDVQRLSLNIDQACGVNLDKLLDVRRQIANEFNRLDDLVALGALLADMGESDDADRTYRRALMGYQDVSPFPLAWLYFQLGLLWGESVPRPNPSRAAEWYQKAIDTLPSYTKARVHLAEVYSSNGRLSDAEALLRPIITVGDPEVHWRLADVLAAQGKFDDAEAQMEIAHSWFERQLERHLLAFADHGAEFYAASGSDSRKALQLARVNVANRPTLRAFELAYNIAFSAGDVAAASEILSAAATRWGRAAAFRLSSQLEGRLKDHEGSAA